MLRSRLGIATVVCFVIGAGLLFPFESTLTRIGGIAFLFAFIICGAFLIANPDDLRDPGESESTQAEADG